VPDIRPQDRASVLAPAGSDVRWTAEKAERAERLFDRLLVGNRTRCDAVFKRCQVRIVVREDRLPNAASDRESIAVTTGMLAVTNDDELAAVLAHELAHLILGHAERIGEPITPTWKMQSEFEADALSLSILSDAGFDPRAAISFVRRFSEASGGLPLSALHPSTGDRVGALERAYRSLGPKSQTR
jgi:predicted Zn-dependent protease